LLYRLQQRPLLLPLLPLQQSELKATLVAPEEAVMQPQELANPIWQISAISLSNRSSWQILF
jgi:hypothetical protein